MRTIDNQYKHSDDYGSYTVCFGDRTIEIKFIGILGEMLIKKFCEDLEMMLRVIDWQYWGVYCDLIECDEASATTQDVLVNLSKLFLAHGCIVETFTVSKPKLLESATKLKAATGLEYSFHENSLFSNRTEAIKFIHNVLHKIKNKSSRPQ